MITNEQAEKVRELHAIGFTHQEIAGRVKISRETAGRIVRGDWNPHERVEPKGPRNYATRYKTCEEYRCEGCGGLINRCPCVLCAVRKL